MDARVKPGHDGLLASPLCTCRALLSCDARRAALGGERQLAPPRVALLAALHAFAARRRDDVDEIIASVVPGDLVPGRDRLGGAQKHLATALEGFGVRPAGMVSVAAEILAGRAVD